MMPKTLKIYKTVTVIQIEQHWVGSEARGTECIHSFIQKPQSSVIAVWQGEGQRGSEKPAPCSKQDLVWRTERDIPHAVIQLWTTNKTALNMAHWFRLKDKNKDLVVWGMHICVMC